MSDRSTNYNQITALLALVKASFKSMLKTPTAILFTFLFPLVFIFAFSYLDPSQSKIYHIGLQQASYQHETQISALAQNKSLKLSNIQNWDSTQLMRAFKTKELDAVIALYPQGDSVHIDVNHTILDYQQINILYALLQQSLSGKSIDIAAHQDARIATLKKIDFILPGQLGFALLAASVFGTAFLFYNLRNNLVLKRFLATPVKPLSIILAECIARMTIQIISASTLIAIGYFVWDYTLIEGFLTYIKIIIVCIFALFTFLSYGFIIASIAKSEATIPPLANIVTLPQFVLAGTFFPVEQLPTWVQYISKLMPLTYFNDSIRAIAFDGTGFTDIWFNFLIILLWGIIMLFVALKTFKWE